MSHGVHYLIVPPAGLLEVIHADWPIDIEHTLAERQAHGTYVRLHHAGVVTSWFVADDGTLNPRARDVFHRLFHVDFTFTGPVLFEGIGEHMMGEIVGRLSLSDAAGGL
jgi:hypothetical protein